MILDVAATAFDLGFRFVVLPLTLGFGLRVLVREAGLELRVLFGREGRQ